MPKGKAAAIKATDGEMEFALPEGAAYHPQMIDAAGQMALLAAVRGVIKEAPLYHPEMPRTGAPLSVAMTNCGPLGWVSDAAGGYRYQATHPGTGRPWPAIPAPIAALWQAVGGYPGPAQACLINYYTPTARLGLHRDCDEKDFSAPVVSISLGDRARFRLGGRMRRDPVQSFELTSGDVFVLGGPARLAYHGIAKVYGGTSDLLAEGGRFNLTLRRVEPMA